MAGPVMKVCPKCQLEYRDETRSVCLVDGVALVGVADPRVGRLIAGRFVVEAPLGHGGMATVYRGEEIATGRRVAIKVMHSLHLGNPELRERFRREARNVAAISHENVVEIFDAGETDDGFPFLVMELLAGRTLRALVEAGPMSIPLVLETGAQIARGLARAHDLGIIHRDLKPENVLVLEMGGGLHAKIVDFGLARGQEDRRMTAAGAILGTPAYLAPERVRAQPPGPGADLYALGIVIFEMITGRLPFESESLEGFLFHHLETAPPRPSTLAPACPAALDSLVLRLLEKSPRERPVDAHQVVRELSAMQADVAQPASRGSLPGDATDPSGFVAPPNRNASSRDEKYPASGTLGFDRWVRRALILESMVRRAYARSTIPPEIASDIAALKAAVVRAESLRSARAAQQVKLDNVGSRSRDARARLGRALHALGRDLSAAREALEKARAEVARREVETSDLEFQIHALRMNLGEHEQAAELERAEAERVLLETGRDVEASQRSMGEATRSIVGALRALPGGEQLVLDLD